MKTKTIWLCSVGLVFLLVFAPVSPVQANPPEKFTVEVDAYEIDETICEFPITKHFYGPIKHTLWVDANGAFLRQFSTFGTFNVDWYAEGGTTMLHPLPQGPEKGELVSPTEFHYTITGPALWLIVPGYGPAAGDVGLQAYVFDQYWNLVSVKSAVNPEFGEADRQAICDYLRP